jgi:hypothetical protein
MQYDVYYEGHKNNGSSFDDKTLAADYMLAVNGMSDDNDRPGMKGRSRHNKLAELHRWGWSIRDGARPAKVTKKKVKRRCAGGRGGCRYRERSKKCPRCLARYESARSADICDYSRSDVNKTGYFCHDCKSCNDYDNYR